MNKSHSMLIRTSVAWILVALMLAMNSYLILLVIKMKSQSGIAMRFGLVAGMALALSIASAIAVFLLRAGNVVSYLAGFFLGLTMVFCLL